MPPSSPRTSSPPALYLDYAHDGQALRGELYLPQASGNGRAALVVHEADGIGGNVRRHCAMLADLGYVAFAADMHGGGAVLDGAAMQSALDHFRSDPDLLRGRVRAALDALTRLPEVDAGRVVALGYCFGGFAILELARSGAPLRAVASFHGLLTTSRPARQAIEAPRIAVFTGALDPLVPPADVAAFQAEMMTAELDWQMTIYGRARHSFTNSGVDALSDPRMAYDEQADAQSWAAMLEFFNACFAE